MSVFDSPANETAGTTDQGTDPRPRHGLLGIDSGGAHHVHQTRTERVLVIDPDEGTIVHVVGEDEPLDVDAWVDAVSDEFGWEKCYYGTHADGLLAGIGDILGGDR